MMKKRVVFSLFMAFTAFTFIAAQDLDEILDTYFETIGQEKLLKVKTMEATGTVIIPMAGEASFKSYNKKPDKMRVEIVLQGNTIVQAYDGINAWAINPMSGSAAPIDMTGPEADGMIESADMEGLLWDYKAKGHEMELEGTEEVEGTEVFVLKLTKKNGNIDYYYIDSENYVVIKVKSKMMMNGQEIEAETFLSNYQEVDGYLGAFTTEQRYNGQTAVTINMDEVKYDVEIEDALFTKPSGE